MKDPVLAIVDGNNHCLRNIGGASFRTGEGEILQTSDGIPTNMLLGSINSLASMRRRLEFTHLVFTFDWGRSLYRLAIRPEYKANRKEGGFSFDPKPQFAMFQEYLDLIGVPWVRKYGVEADDLIASIVDKAAGVPTIVVSADHDLLQLVSDTVTVYRPSIGKTPEVMYDPATVHAKYGLWPSQLPEMWAMMGDTGDGVRGIEKVGPKTATKYLLKHGSLEAVIANEAKVKDNDSLVRENLDLIRLDGSRNFDDIPDDLDLYFDPQSTPELRTFLKRYELGSVMAKMDQGTLWR